MFFALEPIINTKRSQSMYTMGMLPMFSPVSDVCISLDGEVIRAGLAPSPCEQMDSFFSIVQHARDISR